MTQLTIIGFQVASTYSNLSIEWEYTFHLGDMILPSNSYVQTWRSCLRGQVSDSLEKAMLLPANLEHYLGCHDEDLILKLKWHNIAMSFCSSKLLLSSFAHFLFSPPFFTDRYIHSCIFKFLEVSILGVY